jgi:hypothetical protein
MGKEEVYTKKTTVVFIWKLKKGPELFTMFKIVYKCSHCKEMTPYGENDRKYLQ